MSIGDPITANRVPVWNKKDWANNFTHKIVFIKNKQEFFLFHRL